MYYPYVLNELRHRTGKTLVNVFGIAIGIALFVSIGAVSTAYKNAAAQPFKDIGADLIVQRAETHQTQAKAVGRSMRGIRLPFSNQLFRRQDMDLLKRIDGIAEGAQVAAANIYMPLDSARTLLGQGPDALNVIYLRLKNLSMLNPVKSRLSKQIQGASISSSDAFLEIMGGVSTVLGTFVRIAAIVGVLGAILLIMKTMIANLGERAHEIGILKAVGWTQQDVQRQLRIEVFLQTIAGGILGVLAGYAMSILLGFLPISILIPWALNPVPAMARQTPAANQVVRLPVSVSLSLAATALGLSVVTGGVTAYLMNRRTAGMKPADSLRQR